MIWRITILYVIEMHFSEQNFAAPHHGVPMGSPCTNILKFHEF